ncbi:hypothetical protein PG997_001093 [Apiospora hydei]|uniref:Uncharacterized protein n=1 Tax=Apiospora hydei TaxID=1337664 RepID=A0ABR1XCW7_9PEZI
MELLNPSPPLLTPSVASSATVDAAATSNDTTTDRRRPFPSRTSPSPPNSSSSAAAEAAGFGSKPPPKRSQIIQQLSLLVGFLEWIRPAAPNSELCQTVARIVRHVLDQTLDGPPRGAGPEDAAVDWGTVEFATDVSNYFNFDLLDTFDWL